MARRPGLAQVRWQNGGAAGPEVVPSADPRAGQGAGHREAPADLHDGRLTDGPARAAAGSRSPIAALIRKSPVSDSPGRFIAELWRLARTLRLRGADVLACFDRPCTSGGWTEAINGHLEHLRGSALGFPNLTDHIARRLLETSGSKSRLHPQLR